VRGRQPGVARSTPPWLRRRPYRNFATHQRDTSRDSAGPCSLPTVGAGATWRATAYSRRHRCRSDGAPTGSDANSCSAASPRYTMQRIISDTKWDAKVYGRTVRPLRMRRLRPDHSTRCHGELCPRHHDERQLHHHRNRVHYMPSSKLTRRHTWWTAAATPKTGKIK